MNRIIAIYNTSNIEDVEMELSYSVPKSQEMYNRLRTHFTNISTTMEIVQHIDVYFTDNTRRTMIFINGVNQKTDLFIKKKLLAKPLWINPKTKMKICVEAPVAPMNGTIKMLRAKLRLRFIIDDKFDVEMDLARSINPTDPNMKSIKDSLFGAKDIDVGIFDELKIETEFKVHKLPNREELPLDKKNVSIDDIQRSIALINNAIELV